MKLSIITVNYNNCEGLRKTIDSVINQTWRDFEWIVIDGGSTDGSKELIEQYQEHFAYWCSEPDKGVYNAMNKGIEKAKGEYLNFMNSGDRFYDKNVLARISNILNNKDIISGYSKVDGENRFYHYHEPNILLQLLFGCISHQATFIRRTLFDKRLYDENLKIVSDWKFWLETIIIDNCSFEFSDIIVSIQDMSGIATSCKNLVIEKAEREYVLSSLFPKLILENIYDNIKKIEDYDKRYKDMPTFKYIELLRIKSPKMYIVAHRFVRFLSLLAGVSRL